MSFDSWLLFVGACLVLLVVPGPDMALLLARSIGQGRRAGIMTALGINLGAYVHVAAAVLGLSAVLATSATAFAVVKWLGAAYLLWLGARALLSKAAAFAPAGSLRFDSPGTLFWQGFLSDVLNPRSQCSSWLSCRSSSMRARARCRSSSARPVPYWSRADYGWPPRRPRRRPRSPREPAAECGSGARA